METSISEVQDNVMNRQSISVDDPHLRDIDRANSDMDREVS